jgi:hypothetical protein
VSSVSDENKDDRCLSRRAKNKFDWESLHCKKKTPTNGNTLKNVTVEHIFYFISKNVISAKELDHRTGYRIVSQLTETSDQLAGGGYKHTVPITSQKHTRSTSNWRMFWAKTFWSKGAFWHVIVIVKNVSMFVDRIQNAYTATEYSILFLYNLQTRCTRFCRWESYIQDSWPSSLIEACLWCKGKVKRT